MHAYWMRILSSRVKLDISRVSCAHSTIEYEKIKFVSTNHPHLVAYEVTNDVVCATKFGAVLIVQRT